MRPVEVSTLPSSSLTSDVTTPDKSGKRLAMILFGGTDLFAWN